MVAPRIRWTSLPSEQRYGHTKPQLPTKTTERAKVGRVLIERNIHLMVQFTTSRKSPATNVVAGQLLLLQLQAVPSIVTSYDPLS